MSFILLKKIATVTFLNNYQILNGIKIYEFHLKFLLSCNLNIFINNILEFCNIHQIITI